MESIAYMQARYLANLYQIHEKVDDKRKKQERITVDDKKDRQRALDQQVSILASNSGLSPVEMMSDWLLDSELIRIIQEEDKSCNLKHLPETEYEPQMDLCEFLQDLGTEDPQAILHKINKSRTSGNFVNKRFQEFFLTTSFEELSLTYVPKPPTGSADAHDPINPKAYVGSKKKRRNKKAHNLKDYTYGNILGERLEHRHKKGKKVHPIKEFGGFSSAREEYDKKLENNPTLPDYRQVDEEEFLGATEKLLEGELSSSDDDQTEQSQATVLTHSEPASHFVSTKSQSSVGGYQNFPPAYDPSIPIQGTLTPAAHSESMMRDLHDLAKEVSMVPPPPPTKIKKWAEPMFKPVAKKKEPPTPYLNPVTTDREQSGTSKPESTRDKYPGLDNRLVDIIEREILEIEVKVDWDDICGLDNVKQNIKEIILWPLMRPELFKGLREPPKGLLLFGPPGTGKTMVGKAVAGQLGYTFFNISASSLTSKWVGEGEKLVKTLFKLAEARQPSVIFIDEIDSLLTSRSEGDNEASRRIKTEFLVQMDGARAQTDQRIVLIGATNRPEELDEAARRRFVKRLYIPMPDTNARRIIIVKAMETDRKANGTIYLMNNQEIQEIVSETRGYSAADLRNLMAETSMAPLREVDIMNVNASTLRPITSKDFSKAMKTVKSSIHRDEVERYRDWNKKFGSFEFAEIN